MTGQAVTDAVRKLSNYRMIWRWHFYAGLFCILFVIILSITGSIYLFKPQIEAAIDRPFDKLQTTTNPQSLERQIGAALIAVPSSQFQSVEIRQDPQDATRVIVAQRGQKIRVYVHPQSLTILKTVREEARFMSVVKTLHGELVTGRFGELLVELAASWALVMMITGLYLWWPRNRVGLAGVFWPRLDMGRKIFWRDLHGVVGIYVSFFAIFLLLTGLPWTFVWGSGFKAVRAHMVAAPAAWSTGRTGDTAAGHHDHVFMGRVMTDLSGIDHMGDTLRRLDLPPPVMLTAPTDKKPAWQGASQTPNRPQAVTVTLDPKTGAVLRQTGFSDKPMIDQVVGIGTAAHEGQLFGLFNQILGLLTAIGLVTLCVSAVVMWWQRRPDAPGLGAPQAVPDPRLGAGLVGLIIGLGVFLPTMGMALIVVAVIEFAVLRRVIPIRNWLGLT